MKSLEARNKETFLLNSFRWAGKYEIPMLYKQKIDLTYLKFLGFHNTKLEDTKNKDKTVHFFIDDYKFSRVFPNPAPYTTRLKQYKQIISPDFSLYTDMSFTRQLHSTYMRRYCSVFWQSHGITVIPAITWGDERSFEFCFDGIEQGMVVAVSALGSKKIKKLWLAGFKAMCEKIYPSKVLCYCTPFDEAFQMADIIAVPHEGNAMRKKQRQILPNQKEFADFFDDWNQEAS
jgi:hypothetical protein